MPESPPRYNGKVIGLAPLLLPFVQKDPRLEAKVDARAKIVPVAEAVATLGRAAHLGLTTAPAVRDLKATLFVADTPVGLVMDRMADALRLKWTREGDGYRLGIDPQAQAREEAYLNARRALARADLDAKIRNLTAVADVPYKDINDELRTAGAVGSGEPGYEAARERQRALYQYGNLDGWTQGTVLKGLGPAGLQRLLNGEAVGGSTAAGAGSVALPAGIGGYPSQPGGLVMNKSARTDAFLQVDPETWTMDFRIDRAFEGGGSSMTRSNARGDEAFEGRLMDSPLGKELALWDPEKLDGPVAALPCDPKTPQKPSEWWSGRSSDADALEWLHDASGVPIVAMADRSVHAISNLAFAGTVGGYVKRWNATSGWPLFRAAGGVLMYRPGGFWSRRRMEIAEPVLRTLEAKPTPSIDDYAAFVAKVGDRQAALAGDVDRTVLRVCPYPLADGVPPLRLWATLARVQRDALRAGGSVSYGDLSPAGQAAFAVAARGVLAGGWHEGAMATLFAGGRVGEAPWAIFGRTKDVKATGRSRPRPRDERDHPWSPADNEPPAAAIELGLGTAPADAVRYTLSLAGLPKTR